VAEWIDSFKGVPAAAEGGELYCVDQIFEKLMPKSEMATRTHAFARSVPAGGDGDRLPARTLEYRARHVFRVPSPISASALDDLVHSKSSRLLPRRELLELSIHSATTPAPAY